MIIENSGIIVCKTRQIVLAGGGALLPKLKEEMELRYNIVTEYVIPDEMWGEPISPASMAR